MRSPRPQTYSEEPDSVVAIDKKQISKIELQTTAMQDGGFCHSSVGLYDSDKEKFVEVDPHPREMKQEFSLDMKSTEHVVSAQVDTNGERGAARITFVTFKVGRLKAHKAKTKNATLLTSTE